MTNVEVINKHKGYDYCVVATCLGHRCGYVRMEEYDYGYGKEYDDLYGDIQAHGGLTFGQHTSFHQIDGYWIGFDCAHCDDAPDPNLMSEEMKEVKIAMSLYETGTIRSKEYCINWCKSMVDDIIATNIKYGITGGLKVGKCEPTTLL